MTDHEIPEEVRLALAEVEHLARSYMVDEEWAVGLFTTATSRVGLRRALEYMRARIVTPGKYDASLADFHLEIFGSDSLGSAPWNWRSAYHDRAYGRWLRSVLAEERRIKDRREAMRERKRRERAAHPDRSNKKEEIR